VRLGRTPCPIQYELLRLSVSSLTYFCCRTYELLLNGVIPVVEAHPEYDELFKDLPILQLPSWQYSQKDLMKVMQDYIFSPAFLNNTFDAGWERLFLKHWRHQVLHDAQRLNEIILDPDGNQYYTAWQYTMSQPPFIQHAIPEHVERKRQKEEDRQRSEVLDELKRVAQEMIRKSQGETASNIIEEIEEARLLALQRNEITKVKQEIQDAREQQLKMQRTEGGR
jgi:hypothetical protein